MFQPGDIVAVYVYENLSIVRYFGKVMSTYDGDYVLESWPSRFYSIQTRRLNMRRTVSCFGGMVEVE